VSPTEAKETTKREIAVEVPAEEVTRQTEALIQKYQKLARLPGFRKGHAPASIIRQRFSEEIKSDVVEALVPRYFRQEADRQGLVPVSQPRVSDLHIHDGEPLRFKAIFEVLPEIKVEGYKDLRADNCRSPLSGALCVRGDDWNAKQRVFLHSRGMIWTSMKRDGCMTNRRWQFVDTERVQRRRLVW